MCQDHVKIIYSEKRDKERIQDERHLMCERGEKRAERRKKDRSVVQGSEDRKGF